MHIEITILAYLFFAYLPLAPWDWREADPHKQTDPVNAISFARPLGLYAF